MYNTAHRGPIQQVLKGELPNKLATKQIIYNLLTQSEPSGASEKTEKLLVKGRHPEASIKFKWPIYTNS